MKNQHYTHLLHHQLNITDRHRNKLQLAHLLCSKILAPRNIFIDLKVLRKICIKVKTNTRDFRLK